MSGQNAQLRQAALQELQRRRGFYAPPPVTVAPPAVEEEKEPSGFRKAIGNTLGRLTSGEQFADFLGNTAGKVLPAFRGRESGKRILGRGDYVGLEDIPGIGQAAAFLADTAASPLTIATAGFGTPVAAALRTLGTAGKAANAAAVAARATRPEVLDAAGNVLLSGGAKAAVRAIDPSPALNLLGRGAANLIEPFGGNFATRVGAEVATAGGAKLASKAAEEAGLPEPVVLGAGLLGGAFGLKTVGNVSRAATKNVGGYTADEVAEMVGSGDPLRKFTGLLSQAKVQNTALGAERTAEMAARGSRIKQNLAGITDPDARARAIASGMQGELPVHGLDIDMAEVTADDILSIKQQVSDHFSAAGKAFEERRANEAINKVLMGEIPQQNEIRLLQESLGPEFAGVLSKVTANGSLTNTIMNIAGVPRAVMSSFDLSMPFRQGGMLASRRDFWREWKPMVKAFGNENYAKEVDSLLQTDPFVADMARRGMHIPSYQGAKTLAGHEEAFMSDFASKYIPGVKMSERAAVTFLNKLRADTAKSIVQKWERAGVQATADDLNSLAKYMNLATGRGDLPGINEGSLPVILNSLFFSPRFITARMQMLNPRTYTQMSPLVRKEAMRDMRNFFALGTTGLGLATAIGSQLGADVSVELNPQSSDFGKLKIGNTRLDPWAGYQPLARYSAQFLTGNAKMSDGEMRQRDRDVTLGNFVRSKLSPIPSYLVDALKGETFTGEEVDTSSVEGISHGLQSRIAPLLVQDMAEAFAEEGMGGALKTLPAAVGFGVQTYASKQTVRDAGAQELYGKPYKALTGKEQVAVNEAYKEQIAKQQDTTSGVRQFIDNEDVNLRAQEQNLLAGLGTTLNNRQFTEALSEAMRSRSDRISAAIDYEGATPGEQTTLDQYFALRDQALVNGVVDYEKLDQLQNDFMESLPADQQRVVLERTGFQHIPELKWWSDARSEVANSGYYRMQAQSMDSFDKLIQRVAPGVTTYRELTSAALTADDPRQAAVLAQVIKAVDKRTKLNQKVFRLKNPETDKALSLLYGSTPIRTQLAR